jgi:hypothetical protein
VLLVAGLLLLVLIAIVILICKIPGIGPFLYTFAFPLSAITLGATFYATIYVVALHGPAIWNGNGVMRTVALLGAIARYRLFSVIIQSILLGMLVGLVSVIIFGALAIGVSTTSILSISTLGDGMNLNSLMGMVGGMMGNGGGGSGYVKAAGFGMALLVGCAIVAPALIAIAGSCIIFMNVSEDLSPEEIEKSIQGAIEEAKKKADEAKRKLEESRNQLAAQTSAPPAASSPTCPKCQAPITEGDAFCGGCGQRLG